MNDMTKPLFDPPRFDLSDHLVLIPQFWDKEYYKRLKDQASAFFEMILSSILFFSDFTLIVGFLGYPHILTILEFIKNVKKKEIYFLGTAGSLNEQIDRPMALNVVEIHSSAILDHFAGEKSFDLKSFDHTDFKQARGVTVDIAQRETTGWYREQVSRAMDFVEMELFPLRVYLGKPFYALVVTSDMLREQGIKIFDKKSLNREFVKSYEYVVRYIHEKKGHSH